MKLMLVGASGLVGQQVLRQALVHPAVSRVVAPTRKPLAPAPGLDNPLVDFERLPAGAIWWKVDAVICTLGTTMAQAGSQAAFRRVDHDYALAVARLARAAGAGAFVLKSAPRQAARRTRRLFCYGFSCPRISPPLFSALCTLT